MFERNGMIIIIVSFLINIQCKDEEDSVEMSLVVVSHVLSLVFLFQLELRTYNFRNPADVVIVMSRTPSHHVITSTLIATCKTNSAEKILLTGRHAYFTYDM